MAAVRRYDPFRELATLQERMNRIFDDTFSSASRRDDEGLSATWTPPVDVLEKKEVAFLTGLGGHETRRHMRQLHHRRQLPHPELLPLQEREQAEPHRVGESREIGDERVRSEGRVIHSFIQI